MFGIQRARALNRSFAVKRQSLSQLEQVATIGDVTGRSLRFEEMSPEEARRELLAPPSVVNMLLEAWAAAIGLPAFVTSTVAEITGTPARTFRDLGDRPRRGVSSLIATTVFV
jgi:hypothetical protein